MPISLIGQIDAHAIEFANRNAASLLNPAGGTSFADYLASVLQPGTGPDAPDQPPSRADASSPLDYQRTDRFASDRADASSARAASAEQARAAEREAGQLEAGRQRADDRRAAQGEAADAREADARAARTSRDRRASRDDTTSSVDGATADDQRSADDSTTVTDETTASGTEPTRRDEAAGDAAHRATKTGSAAAGADEASGAATLADREATAAAKAGALLEAGTRGVGEAEGAAETAAAAGERGDKSLSVATERGTLRARRTAGARYEIDVALSGRAGGTTSGTPDAAERVTAAGGDGEAGADELERANAEGEAVRAGRRGRDAEASGAASAAAVASDAGASAASADEVPGRRTDAAGTRTTRATETDDGEPGARGRIEVRDLRSRRHDADSRGGGDRRDPGASGDDRSVRIDGGRSASAGSERSAFAELHEATRADGSDLRSGADARAEAATVVRGSDGPSGGRATLSAGEAATLRRTLANELNGEVVRAARLIVRGNESGEIRLHLKPEQLGSVRIALHLQDGHIAGRILVDNQSVREVFEQNLSALQRAFAEAGLDASGLELGLSNAGGGSEGDASGDRPQGAAPRNAALDRFDSVVPRFVTMEEDHDLVDLVV